MFETDQIVEFRIVLQSKKKIFLSTCRSDKHYIKFGCPIPRSNTQEFLSKKFCQVPKPNVARKNKRNGRGTGSTIGSLSNSVFERRTSTGSELFASLGSGLVETLE